MSGNKSRYKTRTLALLASAALTCAASQSALAIIQTRYWSINGAGTWDNNTSNWSTSSTGTPTTTWFTGANAVFAASNVTTTPYTVTLGSTSISALSLQFEDGNVTIAPGSSSTLALTGSGIDVASGLTATINQGFSSTTGLDKTSAGTLVLGGSDSISGGPIDISAGTLTLGSASALPSGLALVMGPTATLNLGAYSTQGSPISFSSLTGSGNLAITPGGEVQVGSGGTSTSFSGVISGSNAIFQKLGAGQLILSGLNTYGGATEIYGGTLQLGASNALPIGTFIGSAGFSNTLDLNGFNQTAGDPAEVINSSATQSTYTINSSTGGIAGFNGAMTGNVAVAFNDSNGIGNGWQLNGADSFSGGLTINGGTLELTNAKTISGGITINSGGSLQPDSDTAMGSNANSITFNGGTLAVTSTFSTARTMTLNSAGGTFDVSSSQNLVVNSSIGGTGGLTKTDSGALTLYGANNYSGATTINGGTLYVGASNTIPVTSNVTVGSSGVLNLGGNNQTIASLSGSGIVTFSSGTLTVADNGSHTFAGNLGNGGSGGFTVAGTGTVALTYNCTFTGPLNVNSGTLQFSANSMTPSTISVGGSAGAIVNQTAGTINASGYVNIARYSNMSATYNLSAGELNAATDLTIGEDPTTTGIFNLSGTGALVESETEYVNGTFTQSGTSSNTANQLAIGFEPSTSGTYIMNGGTLSTGPAENLGYQGNSTFIQNGGTHTTSEIFMNAANGCTSTYTLNYGTLDVTGAMNPGSLYIGASGTGVAEFLQNGGGVTVQSLDLSHYTGNSSYSLGGTGTLNAGSEYIGDVGSGTFTQSTGTTNTAQYIFIAANPYSNGVYNMNGGSLHITGGQNPNLYVGDYWTGQFNQIGGGVTVDGNLYISRSADGEGSYSLSGASSTLTAAAEYVGGFASGVFTQSGGSNTTSTLGIGGTGGGGTYNMQGGTLSVTDFYVGGNASQSYGPGTFAISGGNVNVTGSSTVWSGGTLSVSGGTLSLSGANGSLSSSTPIVIGPGGTLQLDNRTISGGNSSNAAGRLGDSTSVELTGGTFSYLGADNTASTETLAALELISGASTVSLVNGNNGTTAVTFSGGLVTTGRLAGGTVNFAASNIGSTNQVFLTGQPAGFIAGWATVDNGPGGDANFAKYDLTQGVIPLAAADYTTAFTSSGNVRLTGPTTTPLYAPASISTLSLDSRSGSVAVVQAGSSITLNQGGLLALGTNPATIGGGTITSGRADGEIDAYIQGGGSLQLDSQIIDNGGTKTSLVKGGPGTLVLGSGAGDTTANTYTGSTYIQQGILELNKASGTYAISGNTTSQIVIDGGELLQDRPNQIDPRISVAVNSGNAIFNGSQTLPSLTVTNGTATADPGTVVTIGSAVGGGVLPADSQTVLSLTSSTIRATGSTLIVNSSSYLTGASPTVEVDAGTTGTTPGTTGGPALVQLHGDITAAVTSGTGGIVTGTVGAGQSPGVLDLGGMRSFSLSGGTFVISATITDGGINVDGSMELMGSNTYTMGTTISQGTLIVGNPSGLGAASTQNAPNALNFSGGTLELQSDLPSPSYPQQLTTNAGTSSVPGGSMSIDIEPAKNTTAGSFAMSSVTLGSALTVTGSNGGSLTFTNITLQSTLPVVVNTNQTAFHIGINTTINGVISNQAGSTNGDILKDGLGTLTFSGSSANTYLGTTYISGGILALDKSAGIDAVPHDLDVFSGATVELMASGQIDSSSHITLYDSSTAPILNLNGFNNTIGNTNGTPFLTFAAGGTLMTGAGTATLGGDVQLTGTSGTATISGNLNLGTAGRTFTIASSPLNLQIPAAISGGPAIGTTALTKTGPGILTLTGANTYPGDTIVNQGTLTLDYNGSSTSTNLTATGANLNINGSIAANTNLTVNSSGIAQFGVNKSAGILNRTLAAINLSSNGQVIVADPGTGTVNHSNRTVLVTNALTITNASNTWQGMVNLNGNDMIVHGGSVANIYSQLKAGFNSPGGYWNGSGGINSSTAANDSTHLTTLGYRTGGSSFDGVNTTASDVLVKYTYYGDANLDGTVNGADYQQIDNGFGQHLTGWSNGDFNYDGVVDGSDYSLIDNTYNQINATGASPLAIVADPSSVIASAAQVSAVPEPVSLALIGIAIAGSLGRRRQKFAVRQNA